MQIDPYEGSTADYYDSGTRSLLDRWLPHHEWWTARSAAGVDPYGKRTSSIIGPSAVAVDRIGRPLSGVNFASQDYLNLASHPAVIEAAQTAAAQYGVVSLMVV
jgi:glycine C-acetyltransferase